MKKLIGLTLVLMLLIPALGMASPNRVSFLGPEGTYTEEAARFWFQNEETFQARETVDAAVADVLNGEAEFAVIPQENTLGGAVDSYVDALIQAEKLYVTGEIVLPISQTLMALPGAALSDIRTVCSHKQGLLQSARWREEFLPEAAEMEMASTAAAAEYVAKTGDTSIAAVAAPAAASRNGLQVLAENVQISRENRTRFYVLGKDPADAETPKHAVFVVSGPGKRLAEFILTLREAGLGMTAVHDRPEGSALGQYHFLIEVENEEGIRADQISACTADDVRFCGCFNRVEKKLPQPDYAIDRVVVLSRHNIRSPLSGGGSLLGDITPHPWVKWTSSPSELSMLGGVLETMMGQYFQKWLQQEGFFPENYRPEEGAVRVYANAKQRTIATARYFSAGLFPTANVPVEVHVEYDTMDPTFSPVLTYLSDAYADAVMEQIDSEGGGEGMKGIQKGLKEAISLLMEVTDMEESEAYRSGKYGDLLKDETTIQLELGKEPGMTGPVRTATSVADALKFQHYEMPDDRDMAFGHPLTFEDWKKLHSIVDAYTFVLFETPLLAVNVANPLLKEIRAEMKADGRKFSFLCGHDSNIASVLSAMNVQEYHLSDTIEQHTPIGVKLVFTRWLDENGSAYWTAELVYQNISQLRNRTALSMETPPTRFPVHFKGVEEQGGMIPEADFLRILDNAIDAYDGLSEQFDAEEDAAA